MTFRKNCARNKWGRMYHYKGNEKCRLCNEKNNSMHIIYCHEINQLEITLTGDVQVVITRIKASKDHKSTHHTHSWIINKARWNLNNKILYNNNDEVMHPIYQLYFFKQQIKLLEYDHLQLVCHKYTKNQCRTTVHSSDTWPSKTIRSFLNHSSHTNSKKQKNKK